jgi:hypothetical protein
MRRLTLSQRDALLGLALISPVVIFVLVFVA